jgi:hypothetical protein
MLSAIQGLQNFPLTGCVLLPAKAKGLVFNWWQPGLSNMTALWLKTVLT